VQEEQHAQPHVLADSQVYIRSSGGGDAVAFQRSGGREVAFVASPIATYYSMHSNFSADYTNHSCIPFVPAINTT
jgi:hypothetical protein